MVCHERIVILFRYGQGAIRASIRIDRSIGRTWWHMAVHRQPSGHIRYDIGHGIHLRQEDPR